MVSKGIKKTLYIYVEANSKNNTETAYFNLLKQEYSNVNIQTLTKFKALKDKIKKNSSDRYIAVLDGDVDYNNKTKSIENRTQEIYNISKNTRIEVFISNRCWENWLILHFKKTFKPTHSNSDIDIEGYEKKTSWYTKNRKNLIENLNEAIERSKQMRELAYKDSDLDLDVNDLPDLSSKTQIRKILDLNPITFIDLLVEDIMKN